MEEDLAELLVQRHPALLLVVADGVLELFPGLDCLLEVDLTDGVPDKTVRDGEQHGLYLVNHVVHEPSYVLEK